MNTHVVRPAGAGHETLYVLLLCLLILCVAGSVVAWRHESHEATSVEAHQLDARLDLNAALLQNGWKQVIAQFDAGVTRQHRH